MRLTLRTLLGWKDATLTRTEYEFIGSRVSQSRVASGLAERIGAVLSTPPAALPGQGLALFIDQLNDAAEYIDNVLHPHELAGFERTCIESLQRLEEVAACHAILADAFHDRSAARHLPSARRRRLTARVGLAKTPTADLALPPTSPPAAPAVVPPSVATPAASPIAAPAPAAPSPAAPAPAPEAQSSQDAARRLLEEFSRGKAPASPPQSSEPVIASRVPPVDAGGLIGRLVGSMAKVAADKGSANLKPMVAAAASPAASATPQKSAHYGQWLQLLTAAVAVAAILSFGGALASSLQGPRAYKPEPGCLHCTEP